ncbi:hypothetical protein AGABI1DRAFT_132891 [Agaricus bisporus var. burnettii JB137-S8]|uniref:Major facilitator superfamily (MFS) profile domain-containing protein n=1 Tax=Agaricus bisporus var. burnettii (strain JB137-S8 / ATCC MYA-4627 / FGSC 10392) TaxID=597362 RepID=K5VKA2_AGABU|nr:uncharacterized protein AGABI1DRAFT_132891 [Agaricus bisporus var. burnettii JB137-S8]EKM74774.1 hypothetical protein AGABI1DRAFT_132891 [Agaricus bisporus var. burnettii JB137-S8]
MKPQAPSLLESDEKHAASEKELKSELKDDAYVSSKEVDSGAELAAEAADLILDPKEAIRIRRKIDLHIIPLMCVLYWIQFMDKTTLGSAAILGIRESAHLTVNQYNWLGTIFYLSYLVFEFPQNLCLQRFPVAKWMSFNIFVWSIALACHAACTNFAGLFVVRLILGACEGSITAGFLIVTSMFYTRNEQTVRVGWWFLMNGTAQIIMGFISFGVAHIGTGKFKPWQWLMVITGLMTLLTSISFWLWFPDSPKTAWFLTRDEKVKAIRRIMENQTGVENKSFKKEQVYEALMDPKTWLFALFSAANNVPNSITNQRSIIVNSFGFTVLQTTLLGIVDGVIEIATIWIGVEICARIPNSRAYISCIFFIPNILGTFLINFLPWENKIGLLFSQWITGVGTTGFVLALAWVSCVTAGHTKRVTVNAIMLSAYCIGNAVGPFMWQARYKPRNHVPWIVTGVCYASNIFVMLALRWVMTRENKRRDSEPRDTTYDEVYLERENGDGTIDKIRVDKEFLDLTDMQNRDFRYVL